MKNVGIYIGSFNPMHIGHVMITNYVLENTDVSEIVIVPSYHSFGKPELASFNDRVTMVHKSVKMMRGVLVSTIESKLSGYTYETLENFINSKYYDKVTLIIGADNFIGLHKFLNISWILSNCDLIVLGRNDIDLKEGFNNLSEIPGFDEGKIKILNDFPTVNMSSSFIRNEIKLGNDIFGYVMPEVRKHIKEFNLYKDEKK